MRKLRSGAGLATAVTQFIRTARAAACGANNTLRGQQRKITVTGGEVKLNSEKLKRLIADYSAEANVSREAQIIVELAKSHLEKSLSFEALENSAMRMKHVHSIEASYRLREMTAVVNQLGVGTQDKSSELPFKRVTVPLRELNEADNRALRVTTLGDLIYYDVFETDYEDALTKAAGEPK